MAPSHASRLLVASIVLAFASAGSMPADSIFKVLDDLGEDKGEDSLLSSSSSSCLMLGPFPSSSIPIGFRARCSSVIEVLHDWELDERCMGVQGVYQVAADQQQEQGTMGGSTHFLCSDASEVGAYLLASPLGSPDVIIHTLSFSSSSIDPFGPDQARDALDAVRPGGLLLLAAPAIVPPTCAGCQEGGRNTRRSVWGSLQSAGFCIESVEDHGHDSPLSHGAFMALGYRDFSHEETMKGFRVWAGDQGGDATRGARPRRVPHTVIALAKRPITSGACGSSRCGDAEGVWTMNVAVLTQATHRYRQFADGLAASLSQHLATPPEEGGQDDPSCSISGAGRPRVRVLLVVFTDSEEAHHELGGWNDAWGKGSNVAAGIGRGERGVERGRGGAGSYNDGNTFMRRVDHFVHHYGWPQLAMRRWETYLMADAVVRDADFAMHIDCDSLVVSPLLAPSILGLPSFGVLHNDNAYYTGQEIAGFDQETASHVTTGSIPGFMTSVRSSPRGYWDQACFPRFCRKQPPYNRAPSQRCTMEEEEGEYYFYSGFFGGASSWFLKTARTLKAWTDEDARRGFHGARVDDESYLNRLFFESPPAAIMTCAFMYPEPDADISHPWLWTNFPTTDEEAKAALLRHLARVDGEGAGAWRWNMTGGKRVFEPIVLNLVNKDKKALFEGSDLGVKRGLGGWDAEGDGEAEGG